MTDQLDSTFNEMVKFSEALATTLADIFEQVGPALVEFYEGCQSVYLEAGSPYGATDEGMRRWIREVGEARGLQREAELILEHHKTLAYLRERKGL